MEGLWIMGRGITEGHTSSIHGNLERGFLEFFNQNRELVIKSRIE